MGIKTDSGNYVEHYGSKERAATAGCYTIGIDPGPLHSGVVLWDGSRVIEAHPKMPNDLVRINLKLVWAAHRVVCEWIACYGMAVGKEVFDTCRVCGQLGQICEDSGRDIHFIIRPTVKTRLCGTPRAKDPNVRQALIDRLGPVGTKKQPGPLFGVTSHAWSALAVVIAIDIL